MPSYRLLLARVRAAFFAAAERWALLRWRAEERACLESALFEAADRPSRPSAFLIARERLREGALRFAPFFSSRLALRRVSFEAAPFFGGGNRTPARRAFDKPIAIACLVDRAPCLPSRMCSISSRTNSPACVEGDLPSRSSSRARSVVSSSGITSSFRCSATTRLLFLSKIERTPSWARGDIYPRKGAPDTTHSDAGFRRFAQRLSMNRRNFTRSALFTQFMADHISAPRLEFRQDRSDSTSGGVVSVAAKSHGKQRPFKTWCATGDREPILHA